MEPNSSDIDTESDFSEQAKNEDRNLLSKICGCHTQGVLKKLSKKHLRLPPVVSRVDELLASN